MFQKMQTPEWTILFSQSEPQTSWDVISSPCSAQPVPSLISLMVSVDVKHHVYLLNLRNEAERGTQ